MNRYLNGCYVIAFGCVLVAALILHFFAEQVDGEDMLHIGFAAAAACLMCAAGFLVGYWHGFDDGKKRWREVDDEHYFEDNLR